MDFDLAPEQQDFQKTVRAFVDDAIRPNAERWDHEHELPMEAVKQMAELGLFGLPFPEEYGGSGADFLTLCLAIEEIARCSGKQFDPQCAEALGCVLAHALESETHAAV